MLERSIERDDGTEPGLERQGENGYLVLAGIK